MNRLLITVTTACLLLALAPAEVKAQDRESLLDFILPTDSTELQLQGNTAISLDDEAAQNSGTVLANYGWFITERQQIGGTLVVLIQDDDGDLDFSGYGGPFYRYNLLTGKVAPYVGASLAASFGDFGAGNAPEGVKVEGPGDFLAEFEVGSRWFLQRNVSFNLAGSLLYDIDNSELSDVLNIRFGFSYFWQ